MYTFSAEPLTAVTAKEADDAHGLEEKDGNGADPQHEGVSDGEWGSHGGAAEEDCYDASAELAEGDMPTRKSVRDLLSRLASNPGGPDDAEDLDSELDPVQIGSADLLSVLRAMEATGELRGSDEGENIGEPPVAVGGGGHRSPFLDAHVNAAVAAADEDNFPEPHCGSLDGGDDEDRVGAENSGGGGAPCRPSTAPPPRNRSEAVGRLKLMSQRSLADRPHRHPEYQREAAEARLEQGAGSALHRAWSEPSAPPAGLGETSLVAPPSNAHDEAALSATPPVSEAAIPACVDPRELVGEDLSAADSAPISACDETAMPSVMMQPMSYMGETRYGVGAYP